MVFQNGWIKDQFCLIYNYYWKDNVINIENSIINAEKIMKNMKKQDTNNDDNY